MSSLAILAFALRRTWDEWTPVVLISLVWLVGQILVVTGPPATAVLFAATRNTYDGTYWGARDVWNDFRSLFIPAWKWGLPNALVIGLSVYNLSTYWNVPGVWAWLRVVWLLVLLVWLAVNLYYWPFWLAAEDKSLRNTYANCLRFWLLHPGTALVLFLVALPVGVLCLRFALPVVLGAMFWLALVAETAVRRSLEQVES